MAPEDSACVQMLPGSKVLLKFKAGLCNWDGRLVKADKRKGHIVFTKPNDSQSKQDTINLKWISSESDSDQKTWNVTKYESIEKLPAQDPSRTFALRLIDDFDNKICIIFWLQECDATQDTLLLNKITKIFLKPDADTSNLKSSSTKNPVSVEKLVQSFLPTLNRFASMQKSMQSQLTDASHKIEPDRNAVTALNYVSLSKILNNDCWSQLLEDPVVCEELLMCMPSPYTNISDLKIAVSSSAFQHCLNHLSRIMNTAHVAYIMKLLDLEFSETTLLSGTEAPMKFFCTTLEQHEKSCLTSNAPTYCTTQVADLSDGPSIKRSRLDDKTLEEQE